MPRGRPRKSDKANEEIAMVKQDAVQTAPVDRAKYRPLTPEERTKAQEIFMEVYQRTGDRIKACEVSGIHPSTLYNWLNKDETFNERFQSEGRAVLVFGAESHLARIAFGEENVPSSRVTALMAILNAEASEKYRPRSSMDITHHIIPDYGGMKR